MGQDKSRVNRRKMGATRFFIFSTFLALMFGFALSLPTVGNEYPEQVSGVGLSRMIRALGPASNGTPEGLLTRSPKSRQFEHYIESMAIRNRCYSYYVTRCNLQGEKCRRIRVCN